MYNRGMNKQTKIVISLKRSPEALRATLELRRSNAAQPHVSHKVYNRKNKTWKKEAWK